MLLFVFLFSSTHALSKEYTKEELKAKTASFHRMKSAGTGLLTGGAIADCTFLVVLVSGIIARSNDKDYDWWYLDPPEGFGRILLGSIGLVVGVCVTTAGSVVMTIGTKKTKEYQERLQEISFTITPNGVSLGYTF